MHFFFILLLVTYVSCIKNNEEPNVVVRVGETALTEEDLSNSAVFTPEARASYINNWINTELLFQRQISTEMKPKPIPKPKLKPQLKPNVKKRD